MAGTTARLQELLRTPLRAALVLDEQGRLGGLVTAAEPRSREWELTMCGALRRGDEFIWSPCLWVV